MERPTKINRNVAPCAFVGHDVPMWIPVCGLGKKRTPRGGIGCLCPTPLWICATARQRCLAAPASMLRLPANVTFSTGPCAGMIVDCPRWEKSSQRGRLQTLYDGSFQATCRPGHRLALGFPTRFAGQREHRLLVGLDGRLHKRIVPRQVSREGHRPLH